MRPLSGLPALVTAIKGLSAAIARLGYDDSMKKMIVCVAAQKWENYYPRATQL